MSKPKLQKSKIQDAFLIVAQHSKRYSQITMIKIAGAVSVTPQSIYKDYFKSVDEITDSIEQLVTDELRERLQAAQAEDDLLSPFVMVADKILPPMYEERLKYQIFFRQDIFPHLFEVMEALLGDWLRPYLKKKIAGIRLPQEVLLRVEVQFLVSVLSMWLLEEKPIPISLFQGEFLEIVRATHLTETINPKYHLTKKKEKKKKVPAKPVVTKVSNRKEGQVQEEKGSSARKRKTTR